MPAGYSARVDGTDAEGKPTHNEWTGKFDGKDYPLTGDPSADTRSYKVVNDNTTDLTNKKDGKVTQEHCVKYTIRDGVVFDSQALLADVRGIVAKAKQAAAAPKKD